MKSKAFTLIELIIVVIIIGILATFAIPQYQRAVERAKGAKARSNIKLIIKAEGMLRAEQSSYICSSGFGPRNEYDGLSFIIDKLNPYVELDEVLADADWGYYVGPRNSGQDLYVTASRLTGPCKRQGSNGYALQWETVDGSWSYPDSLGSWPPKGCMP